MSNKFKKLKALKAKDEVIYTYGSTSAIAKVVSTDRKIIQVEHMNGKLQEFDVEGDSITGLCSMIRAVDKRELLAIKLSLLWDDDWEVLDEDDLARILYKVVNGRKITPSKSYAGIKERCGVDIDYDEVPHEEYVKNGGEVCPFCKSDESIEATGKFSSVMGINTYLDIECSECGKKWEETYTLSGYKEKA